MTGSLALRLRFGAGGWSVMARELVIRGDGTLRRSTNTSHETRYVEFHFLNILFISCPHCTSNFKRRRIKTTAKLALTCPELSPP
jgi:hypothetical protein